MPDRHPAQPNREGDFKTRKQIIALLKKTARSFGRAPTYSEFRQISKLGQALITRLFGGYQECLRQSGFEPRGSGYQLSATQLLADWVAVTRKLRAAPTVAEYNRLGNYSDGAFARRWRSWHELPAAVLKFAAQNRLQREWEDVLLIARTYVRNRKNLVPPTMGPNTISPPSRSTRPSLKKKTSGPFYGRPIMMPELATAPINEAGVMFLFGALAKALGFLVLRVQAEFPDCEALRCGENGRWCRVRIEFEFESRNFLLHGHDPRECDLIVCWTHNWPSSPLEVLELSKVVER